MFSQNRMEAALVRLFQLYENSDFELQYGGHRLNELSLPEVCQALRDKAETVYEYISDGNYERDFKYKGKELFPARACLVFQELDRASSDVTDVYQYMELWMLEDMSFVTVENIHVLYQMDEYQYWTEYRRIKNWVETIDDLEFSPDDILSGLEKICAPQWEHEATLYAL